jgi:Fe-Mn family superoxide dismutase
MAFEQPPLPYAQDALKGYISEEGFEYHYGKHHAAYFANLNKLVDGSEWADKSLDEVVKDCPSGGMFNNSAQAWNHTFFWDCMSPNGGGEPDGKLLEAINSSFGDFATFKEQFSQAAATLFGSGWAWLAEGDAGKLEIMALSNADTPVRHGRKALLTLDVWEHAYYIDYRNARPKFIEGFWDVANWDFATQNLD